jgi:eukaryotic-like serine/threonine-protein kinase
MSEHGRRAPGPSTETVYMATIGRYKILERLGEGALGELLRARDTRGGRTVALRLVAPRIAGDRARRDALLSDASKARALSHPHVAALFDVGEEDGRVYLAHEYVPGRSLREHMGGVPLSAARALECGLQLAEGVAEGHRLGLAHASLGPTTVFITERDKTKVVDFGFSGWTTGGLGRQAIAGQLAGGEEPPAPDAGRLACYMSPEQILTGRADYRSDIFSLGVLVFELATGRNPFGATGAEAAALNVLRLEMPSVSRTSPALPERLDEVLARATAKSPEARYGSAAAMAADLRALAGRSFQAVSLRSR